MRFVRAAAAGLLATALAASAAPAEPRRIVDGAGRTVEVAETSRVVSVGGAATEILYALGLEDRVVAVDVTSRYPAEALEEKPSVGYIRSLSAEGVLSVDPSLVLAEADAGPPETVELLSAASVPLVLLPEARSAEGVLAGIRLVGDVMGVPAESEALAEAVAKDFASLEAELAEAGGPVRTLFLFSLKEGRILAAGRDTSADAMLELAGAENVFADFSGYKPVSAEAVLAAAPDAIVTLAGTGDGPGASVEDIVADRVLSATPAARAGRIVALDAAYLLGFGPRTAHAAHDLAQALHPELRLPALATRPWVAAGKGAGAP
jgi:iron complex transport system substrate-binding protein